jgi:cytochrome c oxidase subunit 3/cytochrome o ubiquinol oxidase subunit 3
MMTTATTSSTIPITAPGEPVWTLPSKGIVGMVCLIMAESAIFIIFVVAYIFYIGKSLSGPLPAQVLELPIFGTICLLSSSLTIHFAEVNLHKGNIRNTTLGLAGTVLLGTIFLITTGLEWYHLIHDWGLTIRTNLFGTTYYSLVGLHATHVVVGLFMLSVTLILSLTGRVNESHFGKVQVLSYYWHFVDAVWVVVFTVVYVLGR